jgi:enoyl-CoA hydratase/carnithine racemase
MQLTSVNLDITNDGRLAEITIPGGLLSAASARELATLAESLVEQRDVRAVTLRAAGQDFCAGPGDDLDVYDLRPDPATALARLRVPVIAAVDGRCFGPGLEVVLAADIRVATTGAQFALDQITEGRVPAWGGTQRLPRCIGPGAATALALLGTPFDAATAKELGLLFSVADDLVSETAQLSEILLARGPLALEFTKEAVHRGAEMPLRDGLRLEGDLNHQLAATEDRAEGLQAFFDKRPPDFGGR